MTTGKTIALTRGTFVGKVMSLLFNMLSRLVILKNRHYFAILIPACASSSLAFLMMCMSCMDMRFGPKTHLSAKELVLLNCGAGEDP